MIAQIRLKTDSFSARTFSAFRALTNLSGATKTLKAMEAAIWIGRVAKCFRRDATFQMLRV
jgi:hypothetical protein